MNLLEKLRLKSKAREKQPFIKHKKVLLSIATSVGLALTIAFSAFAGVGCKTTPTTVDPTNPNNPTITDPNNPDPTNPDDPTSEYCNIIKDIVSSSYYRDALPKNDSGTAYAGEQITAPHPYAFLQNKGHDISSVKDAKLECESLPYILENDTNHLYVDTRIETKYSDINYYTFYSLKYSIFNKEYMDFYNLSNDKSVLSSFFVQELSAQRTPEVLSEVSLEKSMYNSIISYFKQQPDLYFNDVFDTEKVTFDLASYDLTNQTLKGKFRNSTNVSKVIQNINIRTGNMISGNYVSISEDKIHLVLITPSIIGFATQKDYDDYKNSCVTATAFELQHNNLYVPNCLLEDLNLIVK